MNERIVTKGNAIIVNTYKVVGFGLLAIILLGLVSYLAVQGFFVVSNNWVAPTIISPTDEKILMLNSRMAELAAAREQLMSQRRELKVKLDDAERQVAAQQLFQQRFVASIRGDRIARSEEFKRLASLRREHEDADEEIASSNKAFAGMARVRADQLMKASLLEREGYLTTNHELAQMANATLTLAEHGADLQTRLAALRREIRSLDATARIAGGESVDGAIDLSTTVLMLNQEYGRSQLELAKADQMRQMLRDNIVALDGAVATYDTMLAAIRNSPYMKAIEGNVTVAFVPYENVGNAHPGTKLYGCTFAFFWCREVGEVHSIYDGEVTARHPVRQSMLRGEMMEIELKDARYGQKQVLHLRRAPLFL